LEISTQTVTRYIDLLVDLLLVRRLPPYHANIGKRLWAIEIKRGTSATLGKGFHLDIKPSKAFLVHATEDRYPISKRVEAIGLRELSEMLT